MPVLLKEHDSVDAYLQEKVKRMTPEQRAKFKAREERIQTKRAMKQRMIRA